MTFPVYVGYDRREQTAFDICAVSLQRHASVPLDIIRVDVDELRDRGLYWRTHSYYGAQRIDDIDGKPFSTDFSFTRFLTPHLNGYRGWAIFTDCDFLFTADIAELVAHADDRYAAMVVKHQYRPTHTVKMDGQAQQPYRRKLWSSLVLWNCEHPANAALTPEIVSTETGRWLHGFEWLKDDEIGALPMEWNWIAGVSVPKGIHYSLGTPDMPHAASEYADYWNAELRALRVAHEIEQVSREPVREGEVK